MKLYYASPSPYVRKVMVTAIEAGLDGEIERVTPAERMWVGDGDQVVVESNPLGKIPTLIARDGSVLIDSSLICEYLSSLSPDTGLLPAAGPERWRVLQLQALAQGALDAAVHRFVETGLRPAGLRWGDWITRQSVKVSRTFDQLEAMISADQIATSGANAIHLGTITMGCTLGYLDQRENDQSWRAGRPGLSRWYDDFSQRTSMQATIPPPLESPN